VLQSFDVFGSQLLMTNVSTKLLRYCIRDCYFSLDLSNILRMYSKSELANTFSFIFSHDECSRVTEVPEIHTALYPISHHPQLSNFTYAQKISDCFCSAPPRYKKRTFQLFHRNSTIQWKLYGSPHSKWGLGDSTVSVYTVHCTAWLQSVKSF
jgi:hypothetical protein